MGVKELWSVLAPVKQHCPLVELRGQTVAVDLSMWVVETQGVKQMQGVVTKPFLRNVFFRLSNLLTLDVLPVCVIEGEAPELKYEAMNKRQQTRYGPGSRRGQHQSAGTKKKPRRSHFKRMLKECCEMLEDMGVPYVQSAGEAEATCAMLNQHGVVDGVLTEDGDAFLYGARTVYRNFTLDKKDPHVEVYRMSDIELNLGLDREKLVAMAILTGCDYLPKGVPGVGREMSLRLLQGLPAGNVLQRFRDWKSSVSLARLDSLSQIKKPAHCATCAHPGSARDHEKRGCSLCGSATYCEPQDYDYACPCDWHRSQRHLETAATEVIVRRKALATPGFPHEQVIDEFLGRKESKPKKSMKWNQPRMFLIQRFMEEKCEWPQEYSQDKVLPLLALWTMKHLRDAAIPGGDKRLLQPHSIVKPRVRQGVPCYEILWNKLEGDDTTDAPHYRTIEEQNLVKECYPSLVANFTLSATTAKTTNRKKGKKIDANSKDDKENDENFNSKSPEEIVDEVNLPKIEKLHEVKKKTSKDLYIDDNLPQIKPERIKKKSMNKNEIESEKRERKENQIAQIQALYSGKMSQDNKDSFGDRQLGLGLSQRSKKVSKSKRKKKIELELSFSDDDLDDLLNDLRRPPSSQPAASRGQVGSHILGKKSTMSNFCSVIDKSPLTASQDSYFRNKIYSHKDSGKQMIKNDRCLDINQERNSDSESDLEILPLSQRLKLKSSSSDNDVISMNVKTKMRENLDPHRLDTVRKDRVVTQDKSVFRVKCVKTHAQFKMARTEKTRDRSLIEREENLIQNSQVAAVRKELSNLSFEMLMSDPSDNEEEELNEDVGPDSVKSVQPPNVCAHTMLQIDTSLDLLDTTKVTEDKVLKETGSALKDRPQNQAQANRKQELSNISQIFIDLDTPEVVYHQRRTKRSEDSSTCLSELDGNRETYSLVSPFKEPPIISKMGSKFVQKLMQGNRREENSPVICDSIADVTQWNQSQIGQFRIDSSLLSNFSDCSFQNESRGLLYRAGAGSGSSSSSSTAVSAASHGSHIDAVEDAKDGAENMTDTLMNLSIEKEIAAMDMSFSGNSDINEDVFSDDSKDMATDTNKDRDISVSPFCSNPVNLSCSLIRSHSDSDVSLLEQSMEISSPVPKTKISQNDRVAKVELLRGERITKVELLRGERITKVELLGGGLIQTRSPMSLTDRLRARMSESQQLNSLTRLSQRSSPYCQKNKKLSLDDSDLVLTD